MRIRFVIAVATPLLAALLHAQQADQTTGTNGIDGSYFGQSQSSVNCSDPSMASSPLCGGSMTNGMGSSSLGGLQGMYPGLNSANPLRNSVTTYTDENGRTVANPTPQIPLPPEQLTEFQKFIASTTGEVLPIYGASLFRYVPSTFAPLNNTPVPQDYVLGPDDELRIRVWGQVNFNANLTVDRSGDIYIPQVGAVHVAGLPFDQLHQHLQDAIGRIYRNFQVSAEIGQTRSMQIYLTGEARRPGMFTVSSLSTLIDALFAAGGPSVQGSLRRIELRRADHTVTTLDLYRLLIDGDKSHDAKLLPGDVIFIPPVGDRIAVLGSVHRPAIYEILPGEPVSALLADAGGATELASDTRASIDRNVEHSARQVMEIRLDQAGLATPLRNGDILHVLPLVTHYEKTVTLRGNTANPGRYAWHEGMRLSDLIPDRQSLLTRDYWWKRAQLGLPAIEFQPITALSALRQPSSPVDLRRPIPRPQPATQPNTASGATQSANGTPEPGEQAQPPAAYGSGEDPYADFDASLLASSTASQARAAQGTLPAQPASQTPATTGVGQSAVAGQEEEPAESLNPPRTPRTVVRINTPEIDWSYAVIERTNPVTLKTELVQFDLGKLVNQHDSSQDLTLQPGDVVTIFSQNDIRVPLDEQTTLVRLEGEFAHAGTYSVRPGETLRSLIERAGGLTSNAYLYGSVFTRESTRILQQRRLDEFLRQMTLEMQRGNLALAASPVSNAGDLASANAAQTSERELIAQLQQVRATGRIVFQFRPDAQGLDTIPDIKLENGDTFLIPAVPSTINVLGAVFNQNSFIYRSGSQVHTFLNLAGGPNVDADKKRMFVIRANGNVLSRTVVKGTWGDEFMHLHLYPGDTIIVPEKSIKPSAARNFIEWSQVVSQLGFGAAALSILVP